MADWTVDGGGGAQASLHPSLVVVEVDLCQCLHWWSGLDLPVAADDPINACSTHSDVLTSAAAIGSTLRMKL